MTRVFAVLLLVSLPLAAETLSFSPERPIALPTPGPAAAAQDDPGAASNGDGFLIAWTQWSQGDDVYAARVNPIGEVLDPSGIPVAVLGTDERLLEVFADGRGYMVVWQTARGVWYAPVDEHGEVGGSTLLVPDFLAFGVVGWNGGEFVIVESLGGEIVTRHVDRNGSLQSRTVVQGPDAFVWDVAETPGGAVGVMSDTRTHEYILARFEGHAAPVITALGGGDVGAPRLSVSPGSILVTGRGADGTVHAFLSDLEVTSVRALSFSASTPVDYPLAGVGTAAGHHVYTMRGSELRLHEIHDDGSVDSLTDPLQLIEGRLWAAASSGASDLLAFIPPIPVSGWEPVVRGVVVRDSRAEPVRGGEALVRTAAVQESPIVAGDGEGQVALWSERRSVLSEATQWSAAVTAAGGPSMAVSVPVACQAMAFDGLHRVALCREAEDAIGLRRVWPDGVVESVPYATIAVAQGLSELQLACGDGSCLTGWREAAVVELALVSSSGALVSRLATPQMTGLGRGVRDIRIARGDGVYLVVWSQIMNVTVPPFWVEPLDLYGIRVDERGALIDGEPFVVAASEEDEWDAAAAGGGSAFVVVWSRGSSIFGTRIPAGSSPVEPEASQLAEGRSPSIARFRSDFLVAWEEGNPHAGAESRDVGVGVVMGTGPLELRGRTKAARGSANELGPVIDAGNDGALILYRRVAHEEGIGGVTRIFAREVTLSMRMRPVRR
jgi:hypothetical protein